MTTVNDIELVRQYADLNSEEAFAILVSRYVNMVYAVARRAVGNPHQAEEITQAVFIILARKSGSLREGTIVSGWLYQTARLTAANYLRNEIRRTHREQEAHMQSSPNEADLNTREQIAPLLDSAMGNLSEKDRNAIVLRFFAEKNFKEVGAALGTTEDAAKMRVNRAIQKLRTFFEKRGVALSTAAISGAISANSLQAAPAALAASVTVAVVKGSPVTTSTLTFVKATLKIMAWTKVKTATAVGIGVLFAAGITIVTIKQIDQHRTSRSAVSGTTTIQLSGNPGTLFTGYYRRDGQRIAVSNALPWTFDSPGISEFELRKVNPDEVFVLEARYDNAGTHATAKSTARPGVLGVKVQVQNGLSTQTITR